MRPNPSAFLANPDGGAVSITTRKDTFSNVTFKGNGAYASASVTALTSVLSALGGGLYMVSGTSLTLSSNTFTSNYAVVSGGSLSGTGKAAGGGLFQLAGSLYLLSSNFTANSASGWRVSPGVQSGLFYGEREAEVHQPHPALIVSPVRTGVITRGLSGLHLGDL